MKHVILAMLPFLLALGLGATGPLSQALGFDGWFGIGGKDQPQPIRSAKLDDVEKDLELGPEQKQRFGGFRRYCSGEMCNCRSFIRSARSRLGEVLAESPEDEVEVEQARLDLLVAYEECQKTLVKELVELARGMTPEQRKTLVAAFFPPGGGGCGGGRGHGRGGCKARGCK